MLASLYPFLGPLISLVLFIGGSLLHPVAYMLAFVPLLDAVLPPKKDFDGLEDTIQNLYVVFFVLLFFALWLWFQFSLPVFSVPVFVAGSMLVMWLTSLSWSLGKASSGYFGFLFFWLGFEYALLSFLPAYAPPSLGALMGIGPIQVGWYEETGVLGGSLWVLLVNLLFFASFRRDGRWSFSTPRFFFLILAVLLALVPLIFSGHLYADSSIVLLNQSPWIESYAGKDADSISGSPRGEFLGLIGFWMGIFLAISLFVKQKTRLKFHGRP